MDVKEYGSRTAPVVLLQPVDAHDEETLEKEIALIRESAGEDFRLLAFRVGDWNRDLSPWPAPPVFGREAFGGQARDTLEDVLFAQDVNLDIRLEINSIRYLLDLVANSPLVTILSEEAIQQVRGFKAVPIKHPDGRMDGCLHYLKGAYHKIAAKKFVEFLKKNNSFNRTFA